MTTPFGNGSADNGVSVPDPVTVPRRSVPTEPDTLVPEVVPADGNTGNGNTAGNGNAEPGNAAVPTGVPGRPFPAASRFKIGRGNDGNGNTGTTDVPVPDVPVPATPGAAEAVTDAPAEGQKDSTTSTRFRIDWVTCAMWLVIIALNVLALMLASSGQIEGTWKWAGLDPEDDRRYLLPAITEVGYLGFLLLGADALRRKQSPFTWWFFAAGVAGAAVFMNSVHGEDGYKFEQGTIFGVASGVSLALTFAKFLIDYRAFRQKEGHTSGLRPRALSLGAIFFLPLAIRAHLIIARCEQVTKKEQAYALAEMWRWIHQDTKAQPGYDRRTARRTAWIAVYEQLGQPVPELTNITVKKVTFRTPPPPPPPPPAAPAPTGSAPRIVKPAHADVTPDPISVTPAPAPAVRKPPTVEPKITPAKPVPEEWFTKHAENIETVKREFPDWQVKAPTVREVLVFVRNRDNATETAACIRELRARSASAS